MKIGEQVVMVLLAVVGVAVLAVLVSRQSNTVGVIGSLGNAFSGSLRAALAPVSGSQSYGYSPVTSGFSL